MTEGTGENQDDVHADLLLQYLVVLGGTSPLVWRRIRAPAQYSFWDLHVAIQDAMGWDDSHLHLFRAADPMSGVVVTLGPPDPDGWSDRSTEPEQTVKILDYSQHGAPAIHYTYDFGDDWHHSIIFEEYGRPVSGPAVPECLDGAGACPPEDSGGPHRYAEMLEALADSESPDRDEFLEWIGGDWDPHAFSLEDVWFSDPKARWDESFGRAT